MDIVPVSALRENIYPSGQTVLSKMRQTWSWADGSRISIYDSGDSCLLGEGILPHPTTTGNIDDSLEFINILAGIYLLADKPLCF